MVAAAPELEVGIALLALLSPEVLKVLGTLLGAAQLELKIDPGAVVTSIDGPARGKHSSGRSCSL